MRQAVLETARPLLNQAEVARVVAVIRHQEECGVLVPPCFFQRSHQFPKQPVTVAHLSVIHRANLSKD